MLSKITRAIAVFLVCVVALPVATGGTVLAAFLVLPLPATLPAPKAGITSQISHVLDADGREIGIFRQFETSIPVRKEDIPDVLKKAVVAAEDRNFYKHGGVDLRGTARALSADIRNKRAVQGGSTITQQYVKNAYTGNEKSLVRKVREAVLATQLDRQLDKDEILYRYLSTIYLGDGAYGVGAASRTYFQKDVKDLTLSEAALLAGILPAPTRLAPRDNPAGAEIKRRRVLQQMFDQKLISFPELAKAHSEGIWLAGTGPPPGPATLVYPPDDRPPQYPYFFDYVRRYLVAKYGPDEVYRGGLTVQTTLDPRLQDLAEKKVAETLAGTKAPLEMSLVTVEPPTGFVKALVGGRDFGSSQVNLALGGCPAEPKAPNPVASKVEVRATCWDSDTVEGGGTGRQPGSSFKAFTLATAFSKGISPEKVYPAPRAFAPPGCKADDCAIHNSEGEGGAPVTLRVGTWKSINTVFAQLIKDVGVKDTADMAKKLGITSAWESPRVHGLSYTLGVLDVSPLDMASAYGVFAARGMRADPTPVLRVTDNKGHILEDHVKPNATRVLDEVVADNVTDVLRGVITSGTASPRADIGRPAAGKTGTTQNFSDAWFVGYTPTLSTAVWMGHREDRTPLLNVHGVARVFGGTLPAQTWHNFMLEALKDVPVTDFSQPAPIKALVAADLRRQARQGIDPGARRSPSDTPASCDGPCETGPPVPRAVAPVTTPTTVFVDTTTTEPSGGGGPATTTTTRPLIG